MGHTTSRMTVSLALALGVLLAVVGLQPGAASTLAPEDDTRIEKVTTLDERLAVVLDRARTGPDVEGRGAVPITIEVFARGAIGTAVQALAAVAATDVVVLGEMIVATVPLDGLRSLRMDDRIVWIRPASRPRPEVSPVGVAFVDATASIRITGTVSRLRSSTSALPGTHTPGAGELPLRSPPSTIAVVGIAANGEDRGTAVAEIVLVAPPSSISCASTTSAIWRWRWARQSLPGLTSSTTRWMVQHRAAADPVLGAILRTRTPGSCSSTRRLPREPQGGPLPTSTATAPRLRQRR